MKLMLTIVSTWILFTSIAFAGPLSGGCQANYKGKKIVFTGMLREKLNFKSGKGGLVFDRRPIADFEGDDLKVGLIFRTFKMKNDRGDILEGKVVDADKATGLITRLYVRGSGLDLSNVPMQCWWK